jgi:hypothetical protein
MLDCGGGVERWRKPGLLGAASADDDDDVRRPFDNDARLSRLLLLFFRTSDV